MNGGGGVLFNVDLMFVGFWVIVEVYLWLGMVVILFIVIIDVFEVLEVVVEVVIVGDVLGIVGIYIEGLYIVFECCGMYEVCFIWLLDVCMMVVLVWLWGVWVLVLLMLVFELVDLVLLW